MIQIIADTTCGLPRELLKERGIPLIPQVVIFGEQTFYDDKDLDTAAFLEKLLASASLPKTSAPEPILYHPHYAQYGAEGVIVIAPSGKVSGTVRSATVGAQDFPQADIRIVDSLTIAANLGTLVLLADQWAKSGLDADTIVARLQAMIPNQRTYFLVDTLEFLHKGGRIGGAKALLGELLQVKPILTIADGQVEPFEQQRTKKRALARLAAIVEEQCPKTSNAYLTVMHAAAQAEAEALATELKSRTGFADIPIHELPPAIITHGGPKAMGVAFFTE